MDDQFAELQRFGNSLRSFNQRLQDSVKELERRHQAVDPLWKDSFRAEYDRAWLKFENDMSTYLTRWAHRYEAFIAEKARALSQYLHG